MSIQTNPLVQLQAVDQSFWFDGLSRRMIDYGDLRGLIDVDGLRGITSNPTIFAEAVAARDASYEELISAEARHGKRPGEVFDELARRDIRDACDALESVHRESDGRDGFVSLEESPHLAHDYQASIDEGHRLQQLVDRSNLLVKVPATQEGIAAFHELIRTGCATNVTLMFSLQQYLAVAEAYVSALEERRQLGLPLDVPSVASIFISRIDAKIDGWIDEINESVDSPPDEGAPDMERRDKLMAFRGQAAIANAKACYNAYKEIFKSERFAELEREGARPQRLLFASTGPKDPSYADTKYVDALIGPETVVTMQPPTVEAFRDHGTVAPTLGEDLSGGADTLDELRTLGIDVDRAMSELVDEGVKKFADSFDELMELVSEEMRAVRHSA